MDGELAPWAWGLKDMDDKATGGSAAGGAGKAGPATYLIVLRHVVVAQDIAMTIAEHDPDARVIVARTGADALPLLERVERLAVAFVGKGPEEFRDSPVAPAVAERGARVVLMGEDAEARGAAQGFDVLVRPFTTTDIQHRLVARETGPEAGSEG